MDIQNGGKKPPIGIIPKNLWEIQRMLFLKAAIERYYEAKIVSPEEWKEEYADLATKYNYNGEETQASSLTNIEMIRAHASEAVSELLERLQDKTCHHCQDSQYKPGSVDDPGVAICKLFGVVWPCNSGSNAKRRLECMLTEAKRFRKGYGRFDK